MTRQVFIINGSGGVGKDEFVKMVCDQSYSSVGISDTVSIDVKRFDIENYSSISKVKEIAKLVGWNGTKTEKDRKFLSDLKLLTTEYNDMPLNDIKKFADEFMNKDGLSFPKMLFLHIREPREIAKAVKAFKEYNPKTIIVKKSNIKHITSNMADRNVYRYNYDITINNDGTLEELEEKAKNFANDFISNTLKKEY